MSLPEVIFTLERAGIRRSLDLLADSRSRYLASAAKWSKEIGKLFNEFAESLRLQVDPEGAAAAPVKKPSRGQIAALFGTLGIRPEAPAHG